MSAATLISHKPSFPLHQEGLAFWDDLIRECQSFLEAINQTAQNHGVPKGQWVEWRPGIDIKLIRNSFPSTEVGASLSFEHWGPLVKVRITGNQDEDLRFYREEMEVPLSRDLDGRIVAVFGEGRSFSPRQLAAFLTQSLRRCFPSFALPYDEQYQ